MYRFGQPPSLFQLEHQHRDGTWSILQPVGRDPHDAAERDPEREWQRGHVFVCEACEESVRLTELEPAGGGGSPGAA